MKGPGWEDFPGFRIHVQRAKQLLEFGLYVPAEVEVIAAAQIYIDLKYGRKVSIALIGAELEALYAEQRRR